LTGDGSEGDELGLGRGEEVLGGEEVGRLGGRVVAVLDDLEVVLLGCHW
jgi:hypothetical protein